MTGFAPPSGPAPVDRTEELIRAMLAGRADSQAPPWLLGRTMGAVAAAPRAAGGRPGARFRVGRPSGIGLVAALAAMFVVAVLGGGLVALELLGSPASPPDAPAVVVGPASGAWSSTAPAEPSPVTEPTAPPMAGASADPTTLQPDSLAIVTKAGNSLRVRSAPGTTASSIQYSPTLPSGTRLLVLDGPVAADGFDWYAVLTDGEPIRLYGWVAAGAKGMDWIKPVASECWGSLDAATVASLSRIDLLTCYHDEAVTVRGRWRPLKPGESDVEPCDWRDFKGECNPREAWLLYPSARITFATGDGGSAAIDVAVPEELRGRLEAVPHDAVLTATIAMDAPQARSCAVGEPGGGSLPRAADHAVAACRVRYVLQDLDWTDGKVRATSMAQVTAESLPVRTTPDAGAAIAGRVLHSGDTVYVAEGPTRFGTSSWYAVLWEDKDSVYGWVPATVKGHATLKPGAVDCASMADWPSFHALDPWEALACFGDRRVDVDMWVQMTKPYPDVSVSCQLMWARKATSSAPGKPSVGEVPCVATPTWLASVTGLQGRRPGEIESRLAYDPSTVDAGALGPAPQWRRVTGSFMNPASDQCRVVNQATGENLVPPEEAKIYCQAVFVVTGIGPPAGPEPE
jgi:hypothetical protein